MFSWLFLVLSEYCQHMWRYTTKKTPKKLWGHQSSGARAPELWCPFKLNRFFVLISRMGFRNINFSFFLSVFMCSWHFLVLSEHCQHKCENTIKKTPKKNVGAPEFWCPGTRTLVPPMFLTDKDESGCLFKQDFTELTIWRQSCSPADHT